MVIPGSLVGWPGVVVFVGSVTYLKALKAVLKTAFDAGGVPGRDANLVLPLAAAQGDIS